MIAGTIVIEDVTVQFRLVDPDNSVEVTVSDAKDGNQGTYTCKMSDFAVAVGTALHPNGDLMEEAGTDPVGSTLYAAAERAQHPDAQQKGGEVRLLGFRFIP